MKKRLNNRALKAMALRLAGMTGRQAAMEIGVSPQMVSRWSRELAGMIDEACDRIVELSMEVARLKGELDAVRGNGSNSGAVAKPDLGSVPIRDLPLSTRAVNALIGAGVRNLDQLMAMPDRDIIRIRNIGKKTLSEIRDLVSGISRRGESSVDCVST